MAMRRRLIQVATLLVLAGTCGAAGSGAPQVISARFDVLMNGMRVGVMNEKYEAKDGYYRIVSDTRPIGLVALFVGDNLRVTSRGRLTDTGLAPELFEGKRSEDDPRQVRAEFDWEGQRLKLTRRGSTEIVPLPPQTQDQLSVMYQFMFLAPDRPQVLQLSRTSGRKLEQYRYTVHTGVEIETPLGHMATVHLVRQQPPNDDAVEVWLAPQHHYLPVKLLIRHRSGSRFEQVMTKLEINP